MRSDKQTGATWPRPSVLVVATAALLIGTGGCATTASHEASCQPPPEQAKAEIRAATLAGRYALTLVATRGEKTGMSASGTLVLTETPAALRPMRAPGGDEPLEGVTAPLIGSVLVDLESLGATAPGATDTVDPNAPGVLVIENTSGGPDGAGPEITIRFGSVANDRSQTRFDGAYTALFVRAGTDDEGFVGTWASGVRQEDVAGYFCATRVANSS